jgi:hypothetical protein
MKNAQDSKTIKFNVCVIVAGIVLATFFKEHVDHAILLILSGINGIFFRTISYDKVVWPKKK